MNISKVDSDKLNAVLSVTLEKADYEERVSNSLKEYRKKARVDGFRPGKVPFGLITKLYRKPVLVEEVNKLVSESISKYLVEQKLHVLGDPLPNMEDAQRIDWDNDESFEFKFDLGLAPEMDLKVTSKDKFTYYKIQVDEDLIHKTIENYTQRLGEFIELDEAPLETDILRVNLKQLDAEGKVMEEGIQVEEATLSIQSAKDEAIKKELLKLVIDASMVIDLKKAYPSNAEIAGMLKITRDEAEALTGHFELTLKSVSRFKNAEVNQELFDKVFGSGEVKSEEEFRIKVVEQIEKSLVQDSEYRFRIDSKENLLKKAKLELPEAFLKRWLFAINEGKFTAEEIDKDFESFREDLKWQLIKDHLMKSNELEVSQDEIMQVAIETTRMQFAQYGMGHIEDEHLVQFAQRMLEKREDFNNMRARAVEDKVLAHIKASAKIDEKEVTTEKFNKLFEK